jgi:hypothetical protein
MRSRALHKNLFRKQISETSSVYKHAILSHTILSTDDDSVFFETCTNYVRHFSVFVDFFIKQLREHFWRQGKGKVVPVLN